VIHLDNPILFLVSSFVVSGLEAFHCYFIANNLIGNKVKNAFRAITFKDMLLIGSQGTFSLSALFFLNTSRFEALPIIWRSTIFGALWAIAMILLFVIVTRVVKSKNTTTTIDEIVLIFFIYFVCNFIISIAAVIPMVAAIDIVLDHFLRIVFLCTSSIIFTIIFLWALDKVDMNKLFVFVDHRLALKLAVFIISLLSLVSIFFIVTFSERFYYPTAIRTIIPLLITFILLIIGFLHTLRSAQQYEVVVPEKYHDMKRILTLLNLKAEDAQTVDELKGMIAATIKLIGKKVAKPEPQKSEAEPEDFEAFIKSTINSLKLNLKSEVEITTAIQYFESHKIVSAMNISYMLGTLLENAIETGTQYPILVDILSTEHVLFIKVANESESKSSQELYNMLTKGYSTKEKVGRGFGLSKLKKFVDNYKGNITITQEINPALQANYITFTLNF